jgi:hypothetical protein
MMSLADAAVRLCLKPVFFVNIPMPSFTKQSIRKVEQPRNAGVFPSPARQQNGRAATSDLDLLWSVPVWNRRLSVSLLLASPRHVDSNPPSGPSPVFAMHPSALPMHWVAPRESREAYRCSRRISSRTLRRSQSPVHDRYHQAT